MGLETVFNVKISTECQESICFIRKTICFKYLTGPVYSIRSSNMHKDHCRSEAGRLGCCKKEAKNLFRPDQKKSFEGELSMPRHLDLQSCNQLLGQK